VYKHHQLIAILIAFSRCALLIKDERARGGRRVSIGPTIEQSGDSCLLKRNLDSSSL